MTVAMPSVLTCSGRAALVVSISTFTSARSSGTTVTRATASLISTEGAAAAAPAAASTVAAAAMAIAGRMVPVPQSQILARKLALRFSRSSLIRSHDLAVMSALPAPTKAKGRRVAPTACCVGQ